MAPRSLWNGTLSVGLVHVPVQLYSAPESKTIHFHEVHLPDGGRIEHRRFCEKEEHEVPYEEVVRGFEVRKGSYVALEKDEVKAAAGGTGHLIEVDHFVPVEDIDPVYYDRAYYLGAGEKGKDGYRVLHDALERTGRAPIARCTFHTRHPLAGPGAARPPSTTESTGRLSARSTAFSRCTRCTSPTRSSSATTSTTPSRASAPATARSRWRAGWSSRCTRTSTPSATRTSTARPCSR